jgi:diguanylate cyclase (GGDEF)-like protein
MYLFRGESLRQDRRAALLTIVVLAAVAFGTLPFAARRVPDAPAIVAAIMGAQAIIQVIAACILVLQYVMSRYVPVAIYGVLESWNAVMTLLYLGSFPRIVADHGFLDETARPWTYLVWTVGSFSLTLTYHAAVRAATARSQRWQMRFLGSVTIGSAIVCAGWTLFALRGDLRSIYPQPGHPQALWISCVVLFYALSAVLIVSHIRTTRLATTLDLAFGLTVAGFTLATFISIAGGGVREGSYTIGFYVARFEVFVASASVMVALLVQMARIYDGLRSENTQLARHVFVDALTGIANRRYFDEHLRSALLNLGLDGSERGEDTIALLMLDVDNFKRYNDYFGHHRGDQCLRAVAVAISGELSRASYFVARYGGEEFAVVLRAHDREAALDMGERVRAAIEQLAIPAAPGLEHAVVTVSVGICVVSEPMHDPARLIERTDLALYRAKRTGRNRVLPYDASLEASVQLAVPSAADA